MCSISPSLNGPPDMPRSHVSRPFITCGISIIVTWEFQRHHIQLQWSAEKSRRRSTEIVIKTQLSQSEMSARSQHARGVRPCLGSRPCSVRSDGTLLAVPCRCFQLLMKILRVFFRQSSSSESKRGGTGTNDMVCVTDHNTLEACQRFPRRTRTPAKATRPPTLCCAAI